VVVQAEVEVKMGVVAVQCLAQTTYLQTILRLTLRLILQQEIVSPLRSSSSRLASLLNGTDGDSYHSSIVEIEGYSPQKHVFMHRQAYQNQGLQLKQTRNISEYMFLNFILFCIFT